jgi:hypothetical protein
LAQGFKITPEQAPEWFKSALVGNIYKIELDRERMVETNSLDMMQNTSIVTHPESILEMQMTTLVMCQALHYLWGDSFGHDVADSGSNNFMLVLMAEHIISYILGIVKDWDLKKHGEPNQYGILEAKFEQSIANF